MSNQGDPNIKFLYRNSSHKSQEESEGIINVNRNESDPIKNAISGPVVVPQDEKGEHNADIISERHEEEIEESHMGDRLLEGTAVDPVDNHVNSSPLMDILSETKLNVNAPEFVLPQMQTFVTGDEDSCIEPPSNSADVITGKLFHYSVICMHIICDICKALHALSFCICDCSHLQTAFLKHLLLTSTSNFTAWKGIDHYLSP